MKNHYITAVLFLLLVLGSNTVTFADAWTSTSNCNWFNDRYKVHVEIRKAGALSASCKKTYSDCNGEEAKCEHPVNNPYNPFHVYYAFAYAINNPTRNYDEFFGGYDGTNQWVAGGDVSKIIPSLAYQPIIEKLVGNSKRLSGGKISIGKIIFDSINHAIQILNIQGKINTQGFNKANDFSAFALSITKVEGPEDDFSDESYMKRLLWTSRAMINNGRLSFDGDFETKHFKTSYIEGVDEAGVNINSLIIHLPKDIDMNKISVNSGLDNGDLGMGISNKFKINNQARSHQISSGSVVKEEFSFTGFPNPSDGKLNVRIKLPVTQKIDVLVYDSYGNIVKSLYKGEAKEEDPLEIRSDLSGLLPGIYYIKLITPSKILVRKMIKK